MQSMFRMWNSEPVADLSFLNKLKRKHDAGHSESTPFAFDFPPPKRQALAGHGWKPTQAAEHATVRIAADQRDAHRNMSTNLSLHSANGTGNTTSHTSLPCDSNATASGAQDQSERCRNAPSDMRPAPANPENRMDIDTRPSVKSKSREAKVAALRDVVEAQFNLEILLKHDELRLIDTEIAKCQIALEQLRRCRLIPHPGATGFSAELATGTGSSLQPVPGHTRPSYPAPWGVTDGPYSRHYAKWLIQSPHFDSAAPGPAGRQGSRTRYCRAPPAELNSAAPSPMEAPAPRRARLLRKSDNKVVDLHCEACNTNTFGNVQGFLNHMRIKHQAHFKDHEAAAQACGIPVEGADASPSSFVAASQAPKPKPLEKLMVNQRAPRHVQTSPLPSAAASPLTPTVTTPLSGTVPGYVHPLARQVLPSLGNGQVVRSPSSVDRTPTGSPLTQTEAAPHPSFVPSGSTPHLSALLQRTGFRGDLSKHVDEARAPVDLSEPWTPMEEDDESLNRSGASSPNRSTATRAPATERSSKKTHRSSEQMADLSAATGNNNRKRKLTMDGLSAARPQNQTPAPIRLSLAEPSIGGPDCDRSSRDSSSRGSPVDLSPNTADSNPGLVSDREDDDDDARSEAASALSRHTDFDEMVHVADESCGDLDNRKVLSFATPSCERGQKGSL